MTLKEAKTLGPGDIIKGPWSGTSERVIVSCFIRNNDLHWDQVASINHYWPYRQVSLVKKVYNVEPQVNNDYEIF